MLRFIVFLLFFLWFFSSLVLSFSSSLRLKLFVPLLFEDFFSIPKKHLGFTRLERFMSNWFCLVYLFSLVKSNFEVPKSFFFLKGQLISLFFTDFIYVIFISYSWVGKVSSETTLVCYFFWLTADYLWVDYSKIEVNEKLRNWLWLLANLSFSNWADLSWLIVRDSS